MKSVFKHAARLALFLSLVSSLVAAGVYKSDELQLEYSDTDLVINWKMQDLQIKTVRVDRNEYQQVSFANSAVFAREGASEIPYREFVVGVPQGAKISANVQVLSERTIPDVNLVPIFVPGRTRDGVSVYIQSDENTNRSFSLPGRITISEQQYFRDMPIVRIKYFPVFYDYPGKKLNVVTSARINIKIRRKSEQQTSPAPERGLDRLYSELVVNYEQARNWRIAKNRLSKPQVVPDGPWYRIVITEDGLYRISRAALSAAGIDVQSLDPRTIQIFNHGGRPLNVNALSSENNPSGPVENAIYISGEQDGSFDANDYILFYGRRLGGWAFSEFYNDFVYENHPYDTENYYWLTFGNQSGRRMAAGSTESASATVVETHFMERMHFEEDKYNLLASGADWYGYRFFGTSMSASFDFNLDVLESSNEPSTIRMQLKGGSGIHYAEYTPYRYWFTTFLNSDKNQSAIFAQTSFIKGDKLTKERTFTTSEYLKNGLNRINLDYTGNNESCNAYLDWIELYYPRAFRANQNQLVYYTRLSGQVVEYRIPGFTEKDIFVFDVSDPTNVRMLTPADAVQNGELVFRLNLESSERKKILVSSLNSTAINSVNSLTAYSPTDNLLETTNQSELIVITHPSFRHFAQQLVDFRSSDDTPVSGRVVTTDDIYFWFSSGVQDPVAIRNFLRYAYNNWTTTPPAYVLLFGDGHYDYRNIALGDTNRVPPFEISNNYELDSRETDNFYVDINFNYNNSFFSISPDLAVGRLIVESSIDARRVLKKLQDYRSNMIRDGWQTLLTFVADDEVTSTSTSEWIHQSQTEDLATLPILRKFNIRKIYLSAYPSVPGGFGRVKPEANQAIIDQVNEGTLIINYVGHGSPQQWAHEAVLDMNRDLSRIQNEGRLTFWIAATCDFGKYDDPQATSFTEELIWKEDAGAIGVVSAARLVYSGENFRFNKTFYQKLFEGGRPSRRLGEALLLSNYSGVNDQKYHLFGDPSMHLADPRSEARIETISPSELKALSKVTVTGSIVTDGQLWSNFDGGAALIVNDARYENVNTGGPESYSLQGPRLFKGEISVTDGRFTGRFILPKSIRYMDANTGRLTVYAWSENGTGDALGFVDTLTFNGSESGLQDDIGPEINMFFEGQESFQSGDLVQNNTTLIAELGDENGINLTQEVGHKIEIRIDDDPPIDITGFFTYYRDRYDLGRLEYSLTGLKEGEHQLTIQAWDNLNNPATEAISFRAVAATGIVLRDVVNYPNPFADETDFTFQTNEGGEGAEIEIKVYTISGRLIRRINGSFAVRGFNFIHWDGRDEDGDRLANGVYLYKLILRNSSQQVEKIDKLVIIK